MAAEDKVIALGHPSYRWREGQERRLQLVRDAVPLGGARLLDAGCGVGLYVRRFARLCKAAYGIEIDVDRAREGAAKGTGILQASAEHLPFAGSTLDVVFSHEVLEHLGDDVAAIREAYRVLRPGGHLVVFVPNRLYPFETHGVIWRGTYRFGNVPLVNYLPDRWRDQLCPHVRTYTKRGVRRLFAGLAGKAVVHRGIFPGYDNVVGRWPRLGRLLRRITYALERRPWLQFLGLSHFIVFRKAQAAHDPSGVDG